jgi:hypothetical protein
VACTQARLEPAPAWTVSVLWDQTRQHLIVLDPVAGGFALYDRNGNRGAEVKLDPSLELDYSFPMRLERSGSGYLLATKTKLIRLHPDLTVAELIEPFAATGSAWSAGSLNDGVVTEGAFYGYVDAVAADQGADSTTAWHRGFAKVDLARSELDWHLELPLEADGEFASYYFYDRRPYVTEVDGRIYVLRLGDPWSLERITRRGLRTVVRAPAASRGTAMGVYGWNRHLYLLSAETVSPAPPTGLQAPTPVTTGQADQPTLAAATFTESERTWRLTKIDPRRGHTVREIVLPSSAQRLRLIPGEEMWVAIEESSAPTLGDQGGPGTRVLFLPTRELELGHFSCP